MKRFAITRWNDGSTRLVSTKKSSLRKTMIDLWRWSSIISDQTNRIGIRSVCRVSSVYFFMGTKNIFMKRRFYRRVAAKTIVNTESEFRIDLSEYSHFATVEKDFRPMMKFKKIFNKDRWSVFVYSLTAPSTRQLKTRSTERMLIFDCLNTSWRSSFYRINSDARFLLDKDHWLSFSKGWSALPSFKCKAFQPSFKCYLMEFLLSVRLQCPWQLSIRIFSPSNFCLWSLLNCTTIDWKYSIVRLFSKGDFRWGAHLHCKRSTCAKDTKRLDTINQSNIIETMKLLQLVPHFQ